MLPRPLLYCCTALPHLLQIAEGVRNNGTIYLYGAMDGLDVAWSVIPTLFRNITLKVRS